MTNPLRHVWLFAGLIVALLGSSTYAMLAKGPLQVSGVIQVEEVRLSSEFQGTVAQVQVQAGDPISQGQELIVLNSNSVQATLCQAQAAVAAAQADLNLVRAPARAEQVAAQRAQLALAEAEQSAAQAALQAANEALRDPQDLLQQIITARGQLALVEQSVQVASADVAQARSAVDRAEWNTPERHMLELQADAAQAAQEAARADELAARAAFQALQGMREEPLVYRAQAHAAQGKCDVATAALQVRQAQLDDLLAGATPDEVDVAKAELNLAETQLRLAQTQVERMTLRAPVTGTVVECNTSVGETAMPGVMLLSVADLSQVYILAYVPESRVGEVALGQEVDVTVDSFPGRSFTGHVVHVADHAQYTPRNVATKEERVNTVYAVKVVLSNLDGLLRLGMAADATFR